MTKSTVAVIETNTATPATGTAVAVATAAPVEVKKVEEKATKVKRTPGMTVVSLVHSASTGLALVSTNSGFSQRTKEWILADWTKTANGSRNSDPRFKELLAADDVEAYATELMPNATTEDKLKVEEAQAQLVAHFTSNDYEFISRIKKTAQVRVQELLEAMAPAEEEQQEETSESTELVIA